jgi:signal transduction histidine kinase
VVERHNQQLQLTVEDDGVGIPAEILPRIFDPFFTTKRGRGGTGLGLHIVYNLVDQTLGGSIEAISEPGHGTSFRILLPISGAEVTNP